MTWIKDREEIFERLESAKSLIEDAIEELKGVRETDGVSDDLLEIVNTIGEELEQIEAEREEEYAEMMASMTRDYWKAVI